MRTATASRSVRAHSIVVGVLAAALGPGLAAAQVSDVDPGGPVRLGCPLLPVTEASPPLAYTEEAAARGVSYIVADGIPLDSGTGAASFLDLDGDGDPDIVATGENSGIVGFWENDGAGNFTSRTATTGVGLYPKAGGITGADYDADGDIDIYISRILRRDLLLRNNGDWTFTDVTDAAGILDDEGVGVGNTWGDYDGDGWLDLYVSNRTGTFRPDFTPSTEPNRLYRNKGDGTFEEVAVALGVDQGAAPTLTAAFVDYDLDGDADLYIGNDKGTGCVQWANVLFRNDGGTFTDVTAASNTESCTDTMGIAIGDFDENGFPDFYCTNTPPPPGHALMLNQGDGTFDWVAAEAGVTANRLGWACMFLDHDNDTHQALFVVHSNAANYMYDWTPFWPCEEIGAQMGLDHTGPTYNASLADIDADGDLDLLVQDIDAPIRLYINHEGERRRWVRFDVVGDPPNRNAVGARVRVLSQGRWQIHEVLAGGNNYRTQNELTVHFGLGAACRADSVEASWPDGQSRVLTNYSANNEWMLVPPSMLGDSNGDGAIDSADMQRLVSSLGPVRPGLEALDMDGNASIDARDAIALYRRMRLAR